MTHYTSSALVATCLGAVAVGVFLPFSPLARVLGFTPLPLSFFVFLALATAAYLVLVEFAKRHILNPSAESQPLTVKAAA